MGQSRETFRRQGRLTKTAEYVTLGADPSGAVSARCIQYRRRDVTSCRQAVSLLADGNHVAFDLHGMRAYGISGGAQRVLVAGHRRCADADRYVYSHRKHQLRARAARDAGRLSAASERRRAAAARRLSSGGVFLRRHLDQWRASRTFLGAPATDDVVDPQRNTRQLADKLGAAGVAVTLKSYPRASHFTLLGAFARPLRTLEPVLADVVAFVHADAVKP